MIKPLFSGMRCFEKEYDFGPNRLPGNVYLLVEKARKKIQKVQLFAVSQVIGEECMWSPEQLRQFLVFHKVIQDNKK